MAASTALRVRAAVRERAADRDCVDTTVSTALRVRGADIDGDVDTAMEMRPCVRGAERDALAVNEVMEATVRLAERARATLRDAAARAWSVRPVARVRAPPREADGAKACGALVVSAAARTRVADREAATTDDVNGRGVESVALRVRAADRDAATTDDANDKGVESVALRDTSADREAAAFVTRVMPVVTVRAVAHAGPATSESTTIWKKNETSAVVAEREACGRSGPVNVARASLRRNPKKRALGN